MSLKRIDGMKRGVALLPNLLTTANLFCGFLSIVQTLKGNYVFAVYLVIIASFFDFLDGRVARMTGTQSDFGVEYDSLSDLTTFCMAPAILLYKWGLSDLGHLGIAASFLYFACGALRLARYNVQSGGVEKTDFQGLPTPAAAGTVVTYILFYRETIAETAPIRHFPLVALMSCVALLMVSNIRYRSMKKANQRMEFFQLVLALTVMLVILSRHEIMLFITGLAYITVGLLGRIREMNEKLQTAQAERRKSAAHHDRPRRRRFRRRGQSRHAPRQNEPHAESERPAATDTASTENEQDNVYRFIKRQE